MGAMSKRPTPDQPGLFDAPAADADHASGTPPEALPLPDFLASPPAPDPAAAAPAAPAGKGRAPLWARLLGRLLDPWLRLEIEADAAATAADDPRPICYVLEDYGLSNALILQRACREAGLPPPLQPIPGDPLGRKRAYVALSRRHVNALGLLPGAEHKTHSGSLATVQVGS